MKHAFAKGIIKSKEMARRKKMWIGGEVGDEGDEDMYYNSSGEPHTNEKKTEEEPMEYMAEGGEVSPLDVITTFDMTERAKKQAQLDKQREGKKMAEGGEVDYGSNLKSYAEAHPNEQTHKFSFPGQSEEKKMAYGGEVDESDLPSLSYMDDDEDNNDDVSSAGEQDEPSFEQGGQMVGKSNVKPSGAVLQVIKLAEGGMLPLQKEKADDDEEIKSPGLAVGKVVFAKHLKKKMRGY